MLLVVVILPVEMLLTTSTSFNLIFAFSSAASPQGSLVLHRAIGRVQALQPTKLTTYFWPLTFDRL
jgi:hypothetical protein